MIDAEGYVKTAQPDPTRTASRGDNVRTLGFYFTTTQSTATNVWDVVMKDGFLYASDIGNGLHVLHFYGDEVGDPGLTSIG